MLYPNIGRAKCERLTALLSATDPLMITSKEGKRRGRECELLVLRILMEARYLPHWIVGPFIHVKKNSPLDSQGIDLQVGTTEGFIGVQVKAGWFKQNRTKSYYHERGIACTRVFRSDGTQKSESILLHDLIWELHSMYVKRRKDRIDEQQRWYRDSSSSALGAKPDSQGYSQVRESDDRSSRSDRSSDGSIATHRDDEAPVTSVGAEQPLCEASQEVG